MGAREKLLIGQFFPETCRKIKEIGPHGAHTPLDPPMQRDTLRHVYWVCKTTRRRNEYSISLVFTDITSVPECFTPASK